MNHLKKISVSKIYCTGATPPGPACSVSELYIFHTSDLFIESLLWLYYCYTTAQETHITIFSECSRTICLRYYTRDTAVLHHNVLQRYCNKRLDSFIVPMYIIYTYVLYLLVDTSNVTCQPGGKGFS